MFFCHHSGNHVILWLNVARHKKRDDHTLSLHLRCKKLSPPCVKFVKFPRHASSQHAGLTAGNLGRDQKGFAAILGFPNVKCLESLTA